MSITRMSENEGVAPDGLDVISKRPFAALRLSDPFFDSLKDSYPEFGGWFGRKAAAGAEAYVSYDDGHLAAMMYLKEEDDIDSSVNPTLTKRRLKIGTFKVDFEHHTALGKRLLFIALHRLVDGGFNYAYLTMHPQKEVKQLRELISQHGFQLIGHKTADHEEVWAKWKPLQPNLGDDSADPRAIYPFVDVAAGRDWILAIHPEYHRRMFGNIDLRSETDIPVTDERSINTIEKVYLSQSPQASGLRQGDHIVIYRTNDQKGPAYFRSVVSAVCTVTEVRGSSSFGSEDEFRKFVRGRSVYSDAELHKCWADSRAYNSVFTVISFLYDFAFDHRPTRGDLLETRIIAKDDRVVCLPISKDRFRRILKLGESDEGYLVDQA